MDSSAALSLNNYNYHGVVRFVHRDKFYAFLEVELPGSNSNINDVTVIHFRPHQAMQPDELSSLRVGTNVLFNEIGFGSPSNTVKGPLIIFNDDSKIVHQVLDEYDSDDPDMRCPQQKKLRREIDGLIEDEEGVALQVIRQDDADEHVVPSGGQPMESRREGFINSLDSFDLCDFLTRGFGYTRDGILRTRDVVEIEEAFDLYRIPRQLEILRDFRESKLFEPGDFSMLKQKLRVIHVCGNITPEDIANARRDVDVGVDISRRLLDDQRILWSEITSHVKRVRRFQQKCYARKRRDFFRKHLDVEQWFLYYGWRQEQRWVERKAPFFRSEEELYAGNKIAMWLEGIGLRLREQKAQRQNAGAFLSTWLSYNLKWWMTFFAAWKARRRLETQSASRIQFAALNFLVRLEEQRRSRGEGDNNDVDASGTSDDDEDLFV